MIPGSIPGLAASATSGAQSSTDARGTGGAGGRNGPTYQITTGGSKASSSGVGLGAENSILWIAAAAVAVLLYLNR